MQVQALRAVEPYLGLEKLYVLGTNCTDNGPREGLEKFLNAASDTPGETQLGNNGNLVLWQTVCSCW
jgi:coenzyme F420-reducing hydrogenase beta subunit